MNDKAKLSAPDARRVLIVEDDPSARRSLLLLLTGRGFDAVAHSGVALALADAEDQPPGCLVTDYRLGDGDGINLLATLRRRGWLGPAILVSAFWSSDLTQRASDAGFAEIFDKPMREYALVDAVGRLTSREIGSSDLRRDS
jgi:FixJ family two-component response regulator